MLSFEVIQGKKEPYIQVLIDRPGLEILLNSLEDLKKFGHVHLLTAANGGHELDPVTPHGKAAIGEVIITTGGDDPVIDPNGNPV